MYIKLHCTANGYIKAVVFRQDAGAQVAFGETHKLVGAHPHLGGWNPDAAPSMSWSDGDVWTLDLDLPPGEDLEFKVCFWCLHIASSINSLDPPHMSGAVSSGTQPSRILTRGT